MNEFHRILSMVQEFRPAILSDPLGSIPILADALQELGELGEESAHAIRYWCGIRNGLRKQDKKWEKWYIDVMEKYGKSELAFRGETGTFLRLRGRLLTMFTEAECFRVISTPELSAHPIFTVAIREVQWEALQKLSHPVFSNTQDLTLDFRESTHIFYTGVVYACERIYMPNLRNIGIYAVSNRQTAALKGRTSVTLMDAVAKGRIPKGTRLWWNGEPT